MQLVAGRARCVNGVGEARAAALAKGDALDGMQLICGLAAQHQPPTILLHLQCTSKGVSRLCKLDATGAPYSSSAPDPALTPCPSSLLASLCHRTPELRWPPTDIQQATSNLLAGTLQMAGA